MITIKIDTENAAFEDNPYELAELLEKLAKSWRKLMFKITPWLLKLPKLKWWVPVHSEIWQRPISNATKPSWHKTSSALLNWKDAQLF